MIGTLERRDVQVYYALVACCLKDRGNRVSRNLSKPMP